MRGFGRRPYRLAVRLTGDTGDKLEQVKNALGHVTRTQTVELAIDAIFWEYLLKDTQTNLVDVEKSMQKIRKKRQTKTKKAKV